MSQQQNLKDLYDFAFNCIQDGKQFKESNQLDLARDCYINGIENFMQIVKRESSNSKKETVKKYLNGFMNELEKIQIQIKANTFEPSAPFLLDLPDPPISNEGIVKKAKNDNDNDNDNDIFERAQSYLDEAIEHDQNHNHVDALQKYKIASQYFLDGIKINDLSMTKESKTKYRDKVSVIVGRCELLAKLIQKQKQQSSKRVNSGVANECLSTKEIRILRNSSFIRNLELLPWIDSDAYCIKIDNDSDAYKDKSGLLPLSEKQKTKFGKWKRIKNIARGKPMIVYLVSPYSITQTLIGDCSFVSSITVTALYEKIFSKKLITSILFPQNNKGIPVYNANGRYAVKLWINGCFRKVEIDDYLPVSKQSKLLCSYSNNPNEFWVSLIEKAFLKVMGGYDFPGSTSSEDLHVLTGWIPERIGFKDSENDMNRMFDRLVSGAKYGDCLITLSSNKMTDDEAERVGLVPSHAYAVLRVEKLANWKFLLIKNPWASKRWKGRFSANDEKNWTPQLRKALNYNPNREKQFDNGIFWMCLTDVMQYFSAIFLNWNPDLFSCHIRQHGFWSKAIGPKNDSYNLGYNPQFTLDVDTTVEQKQNERNMDDADGDESSGGSVWILLSKHMESSKRQEQDKNDFLTLHVYDENMDRTRDRRVFYRKGALHKGTYINSPHYLLRIDVQNKNKKENVRRYTIVISQYEKKHDVSYTITCYSTLRARFRPIDDAKLWKYQKMFNGKWDKNYCGGSPNNDTFPQNPQFKITTFYKTHLRFILEAPVDFSINIQLYLCANEGDENEEEGKKDVSNYDDAQLDLNEDEEEPENDKKGGKILSRKDYTKSLLVADSGAYRPGVAVVDAMNVEQGSYIAIISTFKPMQKGPFKFTVKSVENLQLKVV